MHQPDTSDHALHDAPLIAAHAAGDLSDTDRARADALIAGCTACTHLRRDLVAIAAATRSAPAPATLTRDFRLTSDQAERLRRGSWLRGLLRPFASPSSPIRPVAAAFTSLGIVGLLVGVTLSTAPAGSVLTRMSGESSAAGEAPAQASSASRDLAHEFGAQRTGAAPAANSSQRVAVEIASDEGRHGEDGTATDASALSSRTSTQAAGGAEADQRSDIASVTTPTAPAGPAVQGSTILIAGSLGLLGIGLLLFGLRIASRRLR